MPPTLKWSCGWPKQPAGPSRRRIWAKTGLSCRFSSGLEYWQVILAPLRFHGCSYTDAILRRTPWGAIGGLPGENLTQPVDEHMKDHRRGVCDRAGGRQEP